MSTKRKNNATTKTLTPPPSRDDEGEKNYCPTTHKLAKTRNGGDASLVLSRFSVKQDEAYPGNSALTDTTVPVQAPRITSPSPPLLSLSNSSRGASRKNRVYVFREFIHQTYGEYIKEVIGTSGRPFVVLDVAGGKGDLSWLLRNLDGLDSVVADPRVTKSQHILRSILYLREHPDEAKERAIPHRLTYQPLAALLPLLEGKDTFDSPRHLRLFVDQDLVAAVKCYKENKADKSEWEDYWKLATRKASEAQPLGYKEEANMGDKSHTIQTASDGLRTILSTKLVLGFHPDQATDPALDLALILDVPYCIVPCCVFPKEFPNRQLINGSRVRSYSDLMQYLQEKYTPKTDKLPFHFTETSKNVVVYSLPKI